MRVLLLGGYGNFGKRVAGGLAGDSGIDLLIAGRDEGAAQRLAVQLRQPGGARIEGIGLDVDAPTLVWQLQTLAPDLVIHTCGPFQRRDYRVAEVCLQVPAHYLDLADARDFVAGVTALDAQARAARRIVVSGASTVPGLTAAVIDRYRDEFASLTAIDIGISPGNSTPRGNATVAAILSYVGRPLRVWRGGRRRKAFGWQGLRRHRYPAPIGRRWLSLCDVPDLSLFPSRYAGLRELRFAAGLELGVLHLALWALSWPVRWHLLPRLDRWARGLKRVSDWFLAYGSDNGAMHVRMSGTGVDGAALTLTWNLVAGNGHGPQIPATAAVLLARKLARGELAASGATPCLDLFTLDEFLHALSGFDIRTQLQRESGHPAQCRKRPASAESGR